MKRLVIDGSLCIQCCNCQIACKDEHCDNDWSPLAKPQGEGQFWIKITEEDASTGDRSHTFRLPIICQHCENPVCAQAVPGAVYKREDGIVVLDPEKAKGHPEILEACPYGAIYWNEALGVAQKCTGCAHLIDEGWDEPRCVGACPSDALRFIDEENLTDDKINAPLEILHPEYGTKPTVRYQHLPKPFVGGAIINQEGKSVIGARVTVTHQVNGFTKFELTDGFGDFNIKELKPGYYTMQIEAAGYIPKKITDINLQKALNMNDIKILKVSEN